MRLLNIESEGESKVNGCAKPLSEIIQTALRVGSVEC